MTAGLPLYQPPTRVFSRPSDNARDVLDADRRVVAIGDDDVFVGLRLIDLVVGGDRVRLLLAVERALGPGDVGAGNGGAEIGHAEAVARKTRDVGFDAHSGLDAALDRDVTDARHGGEALREQRIGKIGKRSQRLGIRRQRERDDRRVGRVHLRVGRRVGEVRGSVEPAALMAACTS